eukprot:gene13124-8731_t
MLELCHDGKFPKSICVMYYDECFKIWNDLSAKAKCNELQVKYSNYMTTRTKRNNSSSNNQSSISTSTSVST